MPDNFPAHWACVLVGVDVPTGKNDCFSMGMKVRAVWTKGPPLLLLRTHLQASSKSQAAPEARKGRCRLRPKSYYWLTMAM